MAKSLRYLFWCANEHQEFRIPEFEALGKLFQIPLEWVEKNTSEPWVILNLDSDEQARKILSRSISTKSCVNLWADGQSYEELHQNLKSFPTELSAPYFDESKSFKVNVEAFMNKLSYPDRIARIESFHYLPLKGTVRMDNPDVIFSNFEYWGLDHNNLPDSPLRLFFGRSIGEGQRDLITNFSIKKRKFIGNTTMDPQLSLLMANLGKVSLGDLVLDPFVGTGSLILSAAHFGGYVLGGDIDFLMLHARTRPSRKGQKRRAVDESMCANFEQYGLLSQYLDIVVCDSSKPPWRNAKFNAIITDPPYGIREPTEKIGTTKKDLVIAEEHLAHHVPQKIEYGMGDMFKDLMNFAADNLCPGGRLVFWIPVIREDYSVDKLPQHPELSLVANCEQILSSHTSRRLIVMERLAPESDIKKTQLEGASAGIVPESAATFREQFYLGATEIPRKERKERLKKYGHLNLKGAAQSGDESSEEENEKK